MPNWVDNILKITGLPERINELREFIAGVDSKGKPLLLDFNKVVPMPEELGLTTAPNTVNAQEMTDKYGFQDWYAFCNSQWGTKWNLNSNNICIVDNGDTSGETFELRFDTAWSPPVGIIRALGEKFPDLDFKLLACDPGMEWGYSMTINDGVAVENEITYQEAKGLFGLDDYED